MSATRTAPTPPAVAADPPGPVPRRTRPPGWLDLRLVLGVLLVLGSVLLGARVVTAADATVPVWSATADLAAGTVLTAADLVAVEVRLDDAAGAYLATSTRPEGRTLARTVGAGELVPRSALEEPAELVSLALPVQAGFVPPALTRGQVVDVYAVGDPATGAVGAVGESVSLVVAAAPVQAVSGRSEGVLSTATTTVQVVVSVAADRAPAVLGAIAGRPLVVVVHESVDGAGGGSAPGTGAPGSPASPPAPPGPAGGVPVPADPAVPGAPVVPGPEAVPGPPAAPGGAAGPGAAIVPGAPAEPVP
ncbi:SAF domain-containing protein [Geodermatophilus sabuli]|uniref:SAF domain-containing protein n=1 Tax=Geodermatophilus sabuli TaxID=1564158 RepID=UPI0031F30C06